MRVITRQPSVGENLRQMALSVFECHVENATAFIEAITTLFHDDDGADAPDRFRMRLDEEVIQPTAQLILNRIRNHWSSPRSRVAKKTWAANSKPIECVLSGVTLCTIDVDVPAASPTIAMVYQTMGSGKQTRYIETLPVSLPSTTQLIPVTEVTFSTIVYTHFTSLLTLAVQDLLADLNKTSGSQEAAASVHQQYLSLLSQVYPWTMFFPTDFVAIGDDFIELPRTWHDGLFGVIPGVTEVAPLQATAKTAVLAAEQIVASTAATVAGSWHTEVTALYDAAAPTIYTEDDAWLRLSCGLAEDVIADPALTRLLAREPECLIATVPYMLKRMDPDVGYTLEAYATSIYAASQFINTLRGDDLWANNFSVALTALPDNPVAAILDGLNAPHGFLQRHILDEEDQLADAYTRHLFRLMLGDVRLKWEHISGYTPTGDLRRIISNWQQSCAPDLALLIDEVGSTHVRVRQHGVANAEWTTPAAATVDVHSAVDIALDIAFGETVVGSTPVFTANYAYPRGEFDPSEEVAWRMMVCQRSFVENGWEMPQLSDCCETALTAFTRLFGAFRLLFALPYASKRDLIPVAPDSEGELDPEATMTLRIAAPAALLAAKWVPSLSVATDPLHSPFINQQDSPKGR